ncbi:integrase catalytic domain-containing protein [Trichonephila inaurata madagascariensis]|uniref:Integrase catalytic domain-containing protein n=1 Tax=Trichonephila inaurata madagascariensis TaxID=2747483 RepID=A0A8X7CAF9_9ARAC|nr:integrase catalytic domain-containing protein [Trichonephila inaurata madagascariensis]
MKKDSSLCFCDKPLNGSQNSHILKKTAEELGLVPVSKRSSAYSLFGGVKTQVKDHGLYEIKLKSPNGKHSLDVQVLDQVLVQILKKVLRRILGRTSINFEELNTILCDVEVVINSRPINCLSKDSGDLTFLTPSMFLQDIQTVGVPDLDQQSWFERSEGWRCCAPWLRQDWPLGQVVVVFPGKDNSVRVVKVKTRMGESVKLSDLGAIYQQEQVLQNKPENLNKNLMCEVNAH